MKQLSMVGLVVTTLFASSCTQGNSGTPKLIYRDKNGRELTEADLANATGEVNWSIIWNHNVSQKALELHRQARQAGSSGDYTKALELLAQASKEAPEWPYPLYDAAFTYQRRTKALNERHGPALRLADRAEFRCATDQRRKHCLDEDVQYISY